MNLLLKREQCLSFSFWKKALRYILFVTDSDPVGGSYSSKGYRC